MTTSIVPFDQALFWINTHCAKRVLIRSVSVPHSPVFGLNTEIYYLNLRIQSKCGKMPTRKNSRYGHFLLSVRYFIS